MLCAALFLATMPALPPLFANLPYERIGCDGLQENCSRIDAEDDRPISVNPDAGGGFSSCPDALSKFHLFNV